MEFFKNLVGLGSGVHWSLSITIDPAGQINASAHLLPQASKDQSALNLPPMNFKGTAEELDAGLFASICQPVRQSIALFQNLQQYESAQQAVQKNAQNNKPAKKSSDEAAKATTPEKKVSDAKTKQFDAAMGKVSKLETAGMIGQAMAQLPKAKDYPEFADKIDNKLKELRRKHGGFNLFDGADPGTQSPGSAVSDKSVEEEPEAEENELEEEPVEEEAEEIEQ